MIDWRRSGIAHVFSYELVNPFDLDQTLGWMHGVKSFEINYGYRNDYRYSLTMDVVDPMVSIGSMVRIWHTAVLGNDHMTEALGTFVITSLPDKQEYGVVSGKITGYSVLYKLAQDRRTGNRIVKASQKVNDLISSIVSNSGCAAIIPSNFDASKTFGREHVWEHDTSVLSELYNSNESTSPRSYTHADSYGHVVLRNYHAPADIAPSFNITDVFVRGLSIKYPSVVNRVSVRYARDGKEYYGIADVPVDHPWHYNKIGYRATKNYDIDSVSGDPQSYVTSLANSRISTAANTSPIYAVDTIYFPIECGTSGMMLYDDSDNGVIINDRVFVTQRKIKAQAQGITQSLTLEVI